MLQSQVFADLAKKKKKLKSSILSFIQAFKTTSDMLPLALLGTNNNDVCVKKI